MGDFKSEYKRAVDGLEPDGRLLEELKAAAEAPSGSFHAPPKPNFFVRHRWVFGSAAACLVLALAVGVLLSLGGGRLTMMDESSAAENMALVGNAPYGYGGDNGGDLDGDSAEETFSEGAVVNDGHSGSTAVTTTSPAAASEVRTESSAEAVADDMNADEADEAGGFSVLGVSALRIGELRAVSYDELKALTMTDRSESELTLSDFALCDYIEVVYNNVYYLVLRYNYHVFTFPLVAAFQGSSPADPIVSLRLYTDYIDPSAYIDLREVSVDDLEDFIYPTGYVYNFGDGDLYFDEKDLDRPAPLTDEQFFWLVSKAERGDLTLIDFEELERFGLGYSISAQTLIFTYTDEVTEKEYFLITHFPGMEYDTAPDWLILRRRRSEKELDLLNDYDMLGRFLS